MKKVLRTIRNSSRNQSTADYSRQQLFTFEPRFYEAVLVNKAVEDLLAEDGILVMRDVANTAQIVPITATADLPKVIGVAKVGGEVVLAQNETLNVNFAFKAEVDGEFLVLPDGVTMATLVGDKSLKDVLTGLGFIIHNVTENSKFAN